MFRFLHDHKGTWPIRLMCRVLGVSAGGYYDRRDRPPRPAADRRAARAVEIEAVHAEVKGRYGRPRVHAELAARGVRCGVNTAATRMRAAGVRANTARRLRCTTDSDHDRPVAENVLDREFTPAGPNASWVADITYIPTAEGWVYSAAVEDLYSRAVVGWSMGSRSDGRLVVDALEMAPARRRPGEGLVSHSDRGRQYASEYYRRVLAENGIVCGMSRRGDCWGNAPMESFFATLKKELVHHESYRTRAEARASACAYSEAFDNRVRRHSALGYKSPAEYEQAAGPLSPCPFSVGKFKGQFSGLHHPDRSGIPPLEVYALLTDWHERLRGRDVEFTVRDYRSVRTRRRDVLYLDPPYPVPGNRIYSGEIWLDELFDWLGGANEERRSGHCPASSARKIGGWLCRRTFTTRRCRSTPGLRRCARVVRYGPRTPYTSTGPPSMDPEQWGVSEATQDWRCDVSLSCFRQYFPTVTQWRPTSAAISFKVFFAERSSRIRWRVSGDTVCR